MHFKKDTIKKFIVGIPASLIMRLFSAKYFKEEGKNWQYPGYLRNRLCCLFLPLSAVFLPPPPPTRTIFLVLISHIARLYGPISPRNPSRKLVSHVKTNKNITKKKSNVKFWVFTYNFYIVYLGGNFLWVLLGLFPKKIYVFTYSPPPFCFGICLNVSFRGGGGREAPVWISRTSCIGRRNLRGGGV